MPNPAGELDGWLMPEDPAPPEASLHDFERNAGAMTEFIDRLKEAGSMTFAEIDEIALRHGTITGHLLSYAEQSPNCSIDYAAGMVLCL